MRIDAKTRHTQTVRHTKRLAIMAKLQDEHGRSLQILQLTRLTQREAERRSACPLIVGKYLMQDP